jgi:hypothetical protein
LNGREHLGTKDDSVLDPRAARLHVPRTHQVRPARDKVNDERPAATCEQQSLLVFVEVNVGVVKILSDLLERRHIALGHDVAESLLQP